jgi:hypothetical protein
MATLLAFWLPIASGAFGLIGSFVLAFSLDGLLLMMRAWLVAHDVTTEGLSDRWADVVVFRGMDKNVAREAKKAGVRVKLGCFFLFVAFSFQVGGSIASKYAPPTPPPVSDPVAPGTSTGMDRRAPHLSPPRAATGHYAG